MAGRVVVIGGGAAGMMAAGRAAECSAPVTLLEKMERLGTKLYITGKGRCNLTNQAGLKEFVGHFGPNGRFLYRALTLFSHEELRAFFDRLGVPTVVERGNRVFPYSNKASHVVRALAGYVAENGVRVRTEAAVKGLAVDGGGIAGVNLADARVESASAVVLATGGITYPRTGSTGDGYAMAEAVGHHIVPVRPALVPLLTKEPWVPDLQGLQLWNVRATLLVDDKAVTSEFGEMLFTHEGLSGPIILTMSKAAVAALGGGRVQISLNLKPALSIEQLDARLQRDLDQGGKKHFHNILGEFLPLRMRDLFVTLTGILPHKPCHQVTGAERRRLLEALRDLRMTVTAPGSLDEAIVTAGGVDLREIEPRTMESKLVRGLFFCGEVMDLDGDTGGYNLQAAFSTGRLAGESAAERWHELNA